MYPLVESWVACNIMRPMNRVVLDTNVLFAALASKAGASRRLLELLDEDRFVALVTVPLILEYEDVLKRPENLLKTRLLKPELVDRFLGDFLRHAHTSGALS